MAPKKAPRAGLKAGGAGQGAQKPSEGLRDVAAAYTRFRKSPASLKVLKKAAAAHPSGLAELCLAKAALLQGVQAAIKDESAADGEAALLAGAHEALEHLVTAAVEHHSLAGLNHCLFLLDRGLLGLPGWRLRQAQRARLLEGWSAEGLSAQGAAGFQQLGQDVIESELWLKDMVYTWKDGRLQDTDARQVAEDYQQMASHVAKVARQEGAMSYDAAAVEARHRELEAVAMLDSDEDEEVPSKLTIAAPLSLRLLHFEYLPKSEGKALLDWVQKQREEEQQEQRQRQRQQQQQNRDAEVPAGRLLEASAAQLAARKRAQQLADFLKQQLRVECDGKDVPASNSEAATQQHGVAALLRLASLPLPDFRRLLADTADGGSAAEPGAAAAGTAGAAVEHAIQLLASGGPAPVQFELPAPLQQQQGLPLQAPPSPGSGGGGSSRQQFQWLLEQLLSHPETLADCKRQLFEELPELRYVLGSSQRPPEVSAALPSEYMVAGLGLPPSPDAIMPEEHWLDAYERDVNALRGPYWREDVLRAQTELGRSSVAAGPEAAGRIEIYELDCCEIKSNRASRCFDPLCADLLFFGSEVTGLSLSAAAHNTADILSMIGQRDMWQSKTEVCLKHVLLGHALIEVVLQQQERQRGAQSEGEPSSPSLLGQGGTSGWMHGELSADSDDEAAGGLPGTFVGAESPRSPGAAATAATAGAAGSAGAASAAATAGAASAAATAGAADAAATADAAAAAPSAGAAAASGAAAGAAPPAFDAAATAQLAELHAVAAAMHTTSFAETLSRIVPEGKQRLRGMQACVGAMASARDARGIALSMEAGNLVLQLLPLPDELLSLNAAGTGCISVSMPHLRQLRRMVLRRILAGLRHLASQGHLYRHPFLQRAIHYVNVGLQGDSRLPLVQPGSERWAPWNRLGVAPLSELLVMHGTMAAYFAREYAAGPAALGQEFQDAVAHALSSVQLLHSPLPPAGGSQGGAGEGEAAQDGAAPAPEPVLALSRLGLANAVRSATTVLPTPPAERSTASPLQVMRKSVCHTISTAASLPPAALPSPDHCALSLALCAMRVPALGAALKELRGGSTGNGAASALTQLRRLQLWHNLTLHAYHGTTDLLEAHQQKMIKRCARLMQVLDQPAGQASKQSLADLLCGADDEPGLLRELAGCCRDAGFAFAHECADLRQLMCAQDAWMWHSVMLQLRVLLKEARAQVKSLSNGSTARRNLAKFADGVTLLAKQAVARRKIDAQEQVATLNSSRGALQYVRLAEPDVRSDWLQLAQCGDVLFKLRSSLEQTDGSEAAVRAVLGERKNELRSLLLDAQTTLQDRVQDFLHSRLRMFCMADLTLRSEMSMFATRLCMHSPLEPLAQQLVECALPRKWAQQMEGQQQAAQHEAAAGLLDLGAPPSGQPPAGEEQAAAAAQDSQQQQAVDMQEQQRQAAEEQQRQEAAAAAAAAVCLLEEEEQQVEKQAKERQRKQQAKKQAAQQRAAAAAAAAAAKRKVAEEEAAAAAAVDAAARQELEREAEQRRQAQLEEDQRRQGQLIHERLVEQTRREAELLNRQRQAAEQRRQQQEAEQRRQQQEAEQRRQQQEAEQRRQQQEAEQRRQQQEAEQRRQQQEAEQRRQEEEAEQRRRQQAQEQAQAEQQGQAKAGQQPQQQNGVQAASAAVPSAVVTPAISEQLSARHAVAASSASPEAAAAAPAHVLQPAHGGPHPPLSPRAQQQQPPVPQPGHLQSPQAQAALPRPQQAVVPAPSGRQVGSIDWEAEVAAQERLLGANGELDISKLSLGDALPSSTAGAAGGGGRSAAAASRPGSGGSAVRHASPAPRPGSAGGPRPGSAGSDRPGSADAVGRAERPPARFVSWTGAWVCECGQRNETIKEHCRRCNARDPCLRWFQGICEERSKPCRLPHLWFDLPAERPKREQLEPGVCMAWPHPDFIYKRKPRASTSATKPSMPAAAAWQQPAAAAPVGSSWDAAPGQGWQQPAKLPQPPPQPQAAGGAAAPSNSWAAVAKPQPAAAAAAAAEQPPAAGQHAAFIPQQQAQPVEAEEENELASLLGNMGIGASSAEAAADLAPSSGRWSFDAAAPVQPAHGVPRAAAPAALALPEEAPGSWPAPGQDAEEAELAAAIQASLADAAAVASRHQAGAWQELPAAPRSSGGAAGGAQDAEALALAGLRNEAGEYNCFLNVVVQCLWRCAEFRQQVAGWDASFQARDPVLAALHALFAQLEQQEAARSSAAARGGNGGGRLPPVDPAPLREALAALPGQGFSLGEMNDAAELLLCVYEKVMEAEGPSGRANELAATFGLAVREEVHCAACGKTTHQNAYTQYFYNTQATTLQMARLVADGAASMGALLRDAEAQHRKSCDTDMSGCGALNSVNHFLQGAPRVFTLQVAWETHAPDQDMVAGTLAALDATVDLGEVYQGVERGLHRYALRSMVCYYGQHYQALVLVPEAGGWLMFDDTRVTRVGSWADVRRKCEAGRIQPSVLFYEAVA